MQKYISSYVFCVTDLSLMVDTLRSILESPAAVPQLPQTIYRIKNLMLNPFIFKIMIVPGLQSILKEVLFSDAI